MIKDNSLTEKPPSQSETLRELFSEQKDGFIDALECLYIRNNQGGRSLFAEKWPAAAQKIFSEELVRYDYEGVENDDDRQKRAELEQQSEVSRDEMLAVFQDMESRLVIYGSLQVEELDKIMQQIDRPIAEYIFSDRFVNKYFPKADGGEENSSAETGEVPEGSAQHADTQIPQTDNNQAEPAEKMISGQEEAALQKDVVDLPEIQTSSIGHVDHSFSTTTPNYTKGEDGAESEDMSWLDASEEDEFSGVQPISTEAAAPPPINEPAASESAPPARPPPAFDAPEEQDDAEAGLFDAVRQQAQEPEASPVESGEKTDQAKEVPVTPPVEEHSGAQQDAEPKPEEAPRRPMGMDGVRLAQQEQRRAQEAPPEQPSPPPERGAGDNAAPPPRPPMGMGAIRQDQAAPQDRSGAPPPQEQPEPEADQSSAPQEDKKEEKPAPRIPSLDDIDKHVPKSEPERGPGGFPPIPGSEDD